MSVNHPAEVKVYRYLEDVTKAKRGMSDATIARIVRDVEKLYANNSIRMNESLLCVCLISAGHYVSYGLTRMILKPVSICQLIS